MDEEMNALRKIWTWEIVDLPKESNLLGVNGCLLWNIRLMDPYNKLKLD